MPDQTSIKKSVETELIFQDRIFQLFYMFFEIDLNSFPTVDEWVFLHVCHNLHNHCQGFCYRVGIKTDLQLISSVFFCVFKDIVKYRSHHLADNAKSNI